MARRCYFDIITAIPSSVVVVRSIGTRDNNTNAINARLMSPRRTRVPTERLTLNRLALRVFVKILPRRDAPLQFSVRRTTPRQRTDAPSALRTRGRVDEKGRGPCRNRSGKGRGERNREGVGGGWPSTKCRGRFLARLSQVERMVATVIPIFSRKDGTRGPRYHPLILGFTTGVTDGLYDVRPEPLEKLADSRPYDERRVARVTGSVG